MKNVKVYSTPTCPYCIKAKQYLKANGVEFENIDIAADPARAREIMDKTAQMGVPVFDIEGEMIVGFDKAKIARVLGIE